MFHLTFLNQFLHSPRHVFDWHFGVNTVLIGQVDCLDLKSLKRAFGNLFDVLWPTIRAHLLPLGTKFEPELGGYHHLLADGSEGFAYEFFVCERAVSFSRIEECYAAFDC